MTDRRLTQKPTLSTQRGYDALGTGYVGRWSRKHANTVAEKEAFGNCGKPLSHDDKLRGEFKDHAQQMHSRSPTYEIAQHIKSSLELNSNVYRA